MTLVIIIETEKVSELLAAPWMPELSSALRLELLQPPFSHRRAEQPHFVKVAAVHIPSTFVFVVFFLSLSDGSRRCYEGRSPSLARHPGEPPAGERGDSNGCWLISAALMMSQGAKTSAERERGKSIVVIV